MPNDMLTQAIANLEALAAEMRNQVSPSCIMSVPETYVQCWADKVLTAVSDLKEVEAASAAAIAIVRKERDAAHAHACELSLEERGIRAELEQVRNERDALSREAQANVLDHNALLSRLLSELHGARIHPHPWSGRTVGDQS